MAQQVDYDRIAATFDARYNGGSYEKVVEAMRRLSLATRPDYTLEVGCGTGFWLSALGDLLPHAYGLDLSFNMLRKAAQKVSAARLVCGTAEALPFPSASFDLMFCVNAIHHFPELDLFMREARRLIRPGGSLAVIGMDPHHGRDRWCVYDYFPETRTIDLVRFPSTGAITDAMLRAGFDRVASGVACRFSETRRGRGVLEDPELQRRGCSQLALLTDEQYAAGIARIKALVEDAEQTALPEFKVDIAFMLCRGTAMG